MATLEDFVEIYPVDVMRESGYTTPAPRTLPPRMDLHLLEFYKENPES